MNRVRLSTGSQLPVLVDAPADLTVKVEAHVTGPDSNGSTGHIRIQFSGTFEAELLYSFPCYSLTQAEMAGEIIASYYLLKIGDIGSNPLAGYVELRSADATVNYLLHDQRIHAKKIQFAITLKRVDNQHEAYRMAEKIIGESCTNLFNARDGITIYAVRTFEIRDDTPTLIHDALARLKGA